MGDLTQHFSRKEFKCPCCGKGEIDFAVVYDLEEVRRMFGRPIIIESGWRCEKHNKEVGGVPNSSHLTGKAVDIRCYADSTRYALVLLLMSRFYRIGIGEKFIHVDHDFTKTKDVCWLYFSND